MGEHDRTAYARLLARFPVLKVWAALIDDASQPNAVTEGWGATAVIPEDAWNAPPIRIPSRCLCAWYERCRWCDPIP